MPSRTLAVVGLAFLLGATVPSGVAAEPAPRDGAPDVRTDRGPAPSHPAQRPQAPVLLSVEVLPDPPTAPAVGDAAPRDRVHRTANGLADPGTLAR